MCCNFGRQKSDPLIRTDLYNFKKEPRGSFFVFVLKHRPYRFFENPARTQKKPAKRQILLHNQFLHGRIAFG